MTVRAFATGQSNMMGRGTGGPLWSSVSPLVHVWNNVNPLGANGTAFVSAEAARAAGTFENFTTNNLAVWFCDRLAHHVAEDVNLTMVARGATLIDAWLPGGEPPMLQDCIDVWAATGQEPAHVMLWHQGEGAVSGDYSDYRSDFAAVVAALKSGGVIDDNTIIILGGTAEANVNRVNFNREALRVIAAENAQCFYASSNGLPTQDGTHFTGQALYSFGAERYFAAYMQAQEIGMADIWALVNQGGTPGEPGTGSNKVANIGPLLTEGYRLKGGPIIMTTDQTYEPSEGTAAILVEAQGPGGGGAGGGRVDDGIYRATSGGGGGGYARRWIESPEASYAVEVGLGGAGGAAGANDGSPGTKATKFGLVLTCNPGAGGFDYNGTGEQIVVNGGVGGNAEGGDVNVKGGAGNVGLKLAPTVGLPGWGGNSVLGFGGVSTGSASGTVVSGPPGTGWGSGGAGASSDGVTSGTGGNGADGVVIVWEYQKG